MTITYSGVPANYEFAGAFYDNLTEPNNNSVGVDFFQIGNNQVPINAPYQDLPELQLNIPMADEGSHAKIILMFANGNGHILIAESKEFYTQ